jgi:hypothetical protein
MERNRHLLSLCLLLVACGGSSVTRDGTSGVSALDGTWDILSYAGANLAPSSVTISGGTLTGTVNLGGSCLRALEFTIQGDSMTGSIGPVGPCSTDEKYIRTLNGTRTTVQPDSDTPWNGIWLVTTDKYEPVNLLISGLSAAAKGFRLSFAGGMATGVGEKSLTFTARRR